MELKKTLLSILQERDEILATIAENEGELNDLSVGLLEGNAIEIKTKIEGYNHILNEYEKQGEEFAKLAVAFKKRAKAYENAINHMKNNVKHLMLTADLTRLPGLSCEFKLVKNRGSVVFDVDTDFRALFLSGCDYINVQNVYVPDKESYRSALERGELIPYAKIEDGFSLKIDIPTKLNEK